MRDEPNEYEGVRQEATGSGRGVRDLMQDRRDETQQTSERDERIQERIGRSPTKRFMTGLFFVLYVTLGIGMILQLVGLQQVVGGLWPVLCVGTFPFFWFKPAEANFALAGLALSKVHLLALVVYAVLHVILVNVHRAILEVRVKVY